LMAVWGGKITEEVNRDLSSRVRGNLCEKGGANISVFGTITEREKNRVEREGEVSPRREVKTLGGGKRGTKGKKERGVTIN